MDRDEDLYRDGPAEGGGLFGRMVALVALGAVLMQGWRAVSRTHERLHGGPGRGETGLVPTWEGDATGVSPGASVRTGADTTTGRRAAVGGAAEVDDGLQPFGPPVGGVVPTTH